MKPFTRLTKEQKTRICQSCGKEYIKSNRQSNKWFLNSKYCGNKCYYSDPNYQLKRAKSISQAQKGKTIKEETKRKLSEANKGKVRSEEVRLKMSLAKKGSKAWNRGVPNFNNRGEKNHNWKGGTTNTNQKIRGCLDYKIWRRNVFERDNYTCVNCNTRGGYLNADHIKPFALFPELRFEISNGRTLCITCHYKIGWNPYKEKGKVVTNASLDCPLIP